MRNKDILKLVAGFRRFREKYFSSEESAHWKLSSPQSPKTLIIGCSDSRVDPAIITGASPGELFTVRNVANLVPPYESARAGFHGVSAAIEFAVVNLKVENIIILGHRQCGGIRTLMSQDSSVEDSFVSQWMKIARPARDKVLKRLPAASMEVLCKACELEAIVTSVSNLKTFPFVTQAIEEKNLQIFGIYFDLEQGLLMEFDENQEQFRVLEIESSPKSNF
jgi:carbonic anhydrase